MGWIRGCGRRVVRDAVPCVFWGPHGRSESRRPRNDQSRGSGPEATGADLGIKGLPRSSGRLTPASSRSATVTPAQTRSGGFSSLAQVKSQAGKPGRRELSDGQTVAAWIRDHEGAGPGSPSGMARPAGCRERSAGRRGREGTFILSLSLSPDGRVFATRSRFDKEGREGSFINLWDAKTGEVRQSLKNPEEHHRGRSGPGLLARRQGAGLRPHEPDDPALGPGDRAGPHDRGTRRADLPHEGRGDLERRHPDRHGVLRQEGEALGRAAATSGRPRAAHLPPVRGGHRHDRGLLARRPIPRGGELGRGRAVGPDHPGGVRTPGSNGRRGPIGGLLARRLRPGGVEHQHDQAVEGRDRRGMGDAEGALDHGVQRRVPGGWADARVGEPGSDGQALGPDPRRWGTRDPDGGTRVAGTGGSPSRPTAGPWHRCPATRSRRGTWTPDGNTTPFEAPAEAPPGIIGIAISPDGRTLAAACHETNEAILWDLETRRIRRRIPHEGVASVAFSPKEAILATGSLGFADTLKLWDADTGQPLPTLKDRLVQDRSCYAGVLARRPDPRLGTASEGP